MAADTPPAHPATRIAADIGGTFTDVAAVDEATGKLPLGKAPSTPSRLVDGIDAGIARTGLGVRDAARARLRA